MKILQLHPTLRCDENCAWCAYRGYNKKVDLTVYQMVSALYFARRTGADILKVSGGGEPTLYECLPDMFRIARMLGYQKIYMQTHGKRLTDVLVNLCDDIRVSYGDGKLFSPPLIKPSGFSYVVSRQPDYENLKQLLEYALVNNCYVRITQDDKDLEHIPAIAEIQSNIGDFAGYFMNSGVTETERLNASYFPISFWDAFNYHAGKNPCPCYESPLYGADGQWYPCCKTHVALEITPGYNETMALGREYPQIPYDGSKCRRCYY